MGNESRQVKAHNKESKGKASNQKYNNKHESISLLDSLKRINKLKHMSIESPRTEMQKEKQMTKNK